MISEFKLRSSGLDTRDRIYLTLGDSLREAVDLREWDSLIEDQGDLGSCSANAMTNAYELSVKRLYPDKFVELSRLFVYYNSRSLHNETDSDVGAYIRSTLSATKHHGICREELWPYDISKFSVVPSDICYQDAMTRTISNYNLIDSVSDMLEILNQNKPIIIGLTVYPSFNYVDKNNPRIYLPNDKELDQGGGHAMTIVGYDIAKRQFIVKNSFGRHWGNNGYGWLPFEYVDTESFEKWTFDISEQ
jgi:C1A family cysteine protease